MALNIKNEKTYKLAQSLAREAGETLTQAVSVAISERLERLREQKKRKKLAAELMKIGERFAKRMKGPPIDHAAFLYDEHGLPK